MSPGIVVRHARSAPRLHEPVRSGDLALFLGAGVLLSICFVTGGSSQQAGTGVMLAELMALPILLFALLQGSRHDRLWPARWALAVLILILLLPLLQLLPIPSWLWHLSSTRQALQQDLVAVGVDRPYYRWSLTPDATERDLLSLLPGAALFVSAIAMGRRARRGMLWWVIGLALFSALLAFAQLGAPQDSILNPFPQYVPAMAGVFANKNHQANALAIGLVLPMALMIDAFRSGGYPDASYARVALGGTLMLIFALVLPLVGSRAGVLIALVAAGFVLLNTAATSVESLKVRRSAQLIAGAAVLVLAVGTYGAFAWMHNDAEISGSRWMLSATTLRLGLANAPLGSGFGSFVQMFEQATHGTLMHSGYINNAHDDYVQWWFEGGLPAIVVMLAATVVLIATLRRLARLPLRSGVRSTGLAAFAGILVPVLHSTADYPLRTPALMAVFALLAGISVASAGAGAKARVPASAPA